MHKKRKTTDLPAVEFNKKPRLDCTGRIILNFFHIINVLILDTYDKVSEQVASDNEDVTELANQFMEKCRNTSGNIMLKNDIEHLTLQYFDLGFNVIDEVALEGLDGITLEGEKVLIYIIAESILKKKKKKYTCDFSFVETN